MKALAKLCEQFEFQCRLYTIDGVLRHKLSHTGIVYHYNSPDGRKDYFDASHKGEGVIFGDKREHRKYPRFIVEMVLLDDHYFLLEPTPFGCNSRELVKRLLDNGELKPLNKLQCNIYSTRLPAYQTQTLSYEASMLKSPNMLLKEVWHYTEPKFTTDVLDVSIDNINEYVDKVEPRNIGWSLFVNELIKQKLDVKADCGIIKNFIRQSIRGGEVVAACAKHGDIVPCNKPVVDAIQSPHFVHAIQSPHFVHAIQSPHFVHDCTMLDINSLYPYALSQIDLPLGAPCMFPTKRCATMNDILSKPIFCVEADIEYTKQHELDHPLPKRCVINNIDAANPAVRIINVIRGYYWEHTAKQPMNALISQLYQLRATNPKIKLVLNTMYGKLIQKPLKTYKQAGKEGRTNPLIKSYSDGVYEVYNDVDYKYNFTMVASLLLSKAKQRMNEMFMYCRKNNIPMFYTSTDSLAINTSDVDKLQQFIKPGLGNFKIEARGEGAIFIKRGLYYINDQKFGTVNRPHAEVVEEAKNKGISLREWYMEQLARREGFAET